MHIVALADDVQHVCCRYRLAAFAPHLARLGHTLEFMPWPRSPWAWLTLSRTLGRADAVVWQRRLPSGWQLFLLRRAARRLIFDFDDAVFLRDSYAPRGLHSGRRLRRFSAVCRTVDALACGNRFLADNAQAQGALASIHLTPTCIDLEQYLPRQPHSERAVRLVWIGSSSTLKGLEMIQPMLEDLGRSVPQLRLKMICDRFLELAHLPVEPCPWREATEATELASADIGISWIPNDLWSRGKCGLKVLQYMAAGLPVVANPVGVHPEMIRHGETGFLAESPEQWHRAIQTLAADPPLRQRMGQAGRLRVEKHYSVQAGAVLWNELLQSLASERRQAG